MRELSVALEQIDVRTHNEMAVQGHFHGFQIEMRGAASSMPKDEGLSPEQETRVSLAMERAMERKREAFSQGRRR